MKILPEDLDEAIKYPWDTKTCLLAVAAARETGLTVKHCSYHSIEFVDKSTITLAHDKCAPLVRAFDNAWSGADRLYDVESIADLRAQLPADV